MATVRVPKTRKGRRVLQGREPKAVEDDKRILFVKAGNVSSRVTSFLKDLYSLRDRDTAIFLKKKNVTRPFEDFGMLEKFSAKFSASLFVFGSTSKKRPDNIVFGRLYDRSVLDVVEFGLKNVAEIANSTGIASDVKPMLIFSGEQFDTEPVFIRVKSLLTDIFCNGKRDSVRPAGLQLALSFTAHPYSPSADAAIIHMRTYKVMLRRGEKAIPDADLEPLGPDADLVLRRTHLASEELFKLACKQPKKPPASRTKNKSMDPFGSKVARIHMQRQDLGHLQTRKMKGLKRKSSTAEGSSDTPSSQKKRAVASPTP